MKNHLRFLELLTILVSVALFLRFLPMSVSAEAPWNHYFGQLHSHSGYWDDLSVPDYSPADAFAQAKAGGMDFYGLTDFSHSFDNDLSGAIGDGAVESAAWNAGREAAAAATDPSFVAAYGFEITSKAYSRLDHIATFATPGWQSRSQEGFLEVTDYLDALVTVPGSFGIFCHPDPVHGDFGYFMEHRWDYDLHMPLLEVIGEDGETFYDAYQMALDQGWHVAPAANSATHAGNWAASRVRTVILAEALTEESLYDAIRARRVYASADPEQEIIYRLGGHIMGSQVTGLENHEVTLEISHPEGDVQVVTENGRILQTLPAEGAMSFPVDAGYPYYYLRLVKDGAVLAVTAPVWVEEAEDFGTSDLNASASVPVQGDEVTFSFTLYNHETATMTADSLRLLADGALIWQAETPETLKGLESREFSIPYRHMGVGNTEFSLEVSGSIGSKDFTIQKTLDISYRPAVLNAHILIDGRHSPVTYDRLRNLTSLAAESDMDVGIFRHEAPEGAKVIIVPALEQDFEENYPQLLKNFVEAGGHLILCGQPEDNSRTNRLLEELGATMRLNNDTAADPVNNGGVPESLYPDVFNPGASCWEALTGNEIYSQQFGCTVDPGQGTWLVKGRSTMVGSPVLVAREALGQGQILLAGSFFLDDEHLILPKNPWDAPRANQILMESVLEIQRIQLPISEIEAVRAGEVGEIYRVTGYVTAGTSREHNRFPEMIYLQDGTGGIEITAFEVPQIQVGFSLDITGQLQMDGKNPALKLISWEIIENDLYRHDPAVSDHRTAMDYARFGGELMKIEGQVQGLYYTSAGMGVQRFTLLDEAGDPAEVLIEPYILSGADGDNQLAEQVVLGEQVRAYGILHMEADGTPVLRVRNCDEVVSVLPIPERPEKDGGKKKGNPDLTNPNTGDSLAWFFTFWGF